MTKKEYDNFCKMSNFDCEEKLEFCSSDIAGQEQTTTYYEFIQI
jgi:hypothetical protein